MYAYLRGTLGGKAPGMAVVDIQGVGYRVQIPLSTFYELGDEGSPVMLRITTHVREDAILLYGFYTAAEQELFQHLIGVSGVGPKMAIGILSGMSAPELLAALAEGNAARLQTIPGVGKRTAERLTVDLKDRARKLAIAPSDAPEAASSGTARDDVISALVNLGYPAGQAEKAAAAALADGGGGGDDAPFEDLLRSALRSLH
jgi:Holliday junction DNA helicase RuvA